MRWIYQNYWNKNVSYEWDTSLTSKILFLIMIVMAMLMIVILFEMIFMIMRVLNIHFTNYRYVQMQMTIWNRENINPCFNTTANNVKCWIPKCCKPFVFYRNLNIRRISLLETLKLMHYCYLLVVENMKLFVYWESPLSSIFS